MNENFNLAEYSLLEGGISIHLNPNILEEYTKWYLDNNYRVYTIEMLNRKNENEYKYIAEHLSLFDAYGCQGEFLEYFENFIDYEFSGKAIILKNFDDYFISNTNSAYILLDTLSILSRKLLIRGYHLLIILHSNDPNFQLKNVGGIQPDWNAREWFTSNRVKQ
ncbi:hypothetical protein [Flammeovirga sp. SJP92]|uniref:hypothetical protein n=1 Tax=Flammeovirga sp. SJP92 TaxID=1775430 RepID=UPI00078947F5|nr:hypothetical protein [Flammeovirga sp. SJP92]KXX70002.1 hypothetical protein AVL50_14085 [Flammeovirga sp. SJP92]